MTSFTIEDSQLTRWEGRVAIVTGGSSGIGLSTVEVLLSLGANVVNGDMQEPAEATGARFIRTNVTEWKELVQLFAATKAEHGRIDCVFANAGIANRADFIKDFFNEQGELEEPTHSVINVNLIACINTVKLAIHHMRQQKDGGSIVATASASSDHALAPSDIQEPCSRNTGYQRFSASDYTIAKHGVLGLMRCLYHPLLEFPIRFNCVAPSWTETGIFPKELASAAGIRTQPPSVVARSVALLMSDTSRHGQLIYSDCGVYTEIEDDLLAAGREAMTKKTSDEEDRDNLMNMLAKTNKQGE